MGPITLLLIFYIAPSVFVIGSVYYVIRHFCLLSKQIDEVSFDEVLLDEVLTPFEKQN